MLHNYLQQKLLYHSCIFFTTITIFVVCSGILRLEKCNKWAGKFTVLHKDKKLLNCVTLTVRDVQTVGECSMLCFQHDKCETISYNTQQNVCLLHQGRSNGCGIMKDDLGWVVYETDASTSNNVSEKLFSIKQISGSSRRKLVFKIILNSGRDKILHFHIFCFLSA